MDDCPWMSVLEAIMVVQLKYEASGISRLHLIHLWIVDSRTGDLW